MENSTVNRNNNVYWLDENLYVFMLITKPMPKSMHGVTFMAALLQNLSSCIIG
jgi:hypothetical protein